MNQYVFPRMHAGDLASIDAKYDTAMSTACGALDFIVVSAYDLYLRVLLRTGLVVS